MDELAGLAEKLAALTVAVGELKSVLMFGFTLMDMSYAQGFDDAKRQRVPRRAVRRRAGDSHLKVIR